MQANKQVAEPAFFQHLTTVERAILLKGSVTRQFPKGAQIVRVLDLDTNFYVINSGIVRVTLYSNEGKEVSFVDIEEGGNFGEISAIDGKPRSANVVALTDAELTIVPPSAFIQAVRNNPDASLEIMQQLAGVVRRLCDRVFEYSTLDVGNRIHAELLRLASFHVDLDGVARIHNPPTQAEMANRVSCTREAISRELKKLERAGVISRKPKRLIVDDMKRLRDLVNDVASR